MMSGGAVWYNHSLKSPRREGVAERGAIFFARIQATVYFKERLLNCIIHASFVHKKDNEAETLEKESSSSLHAVRDVAPAAVSC